MSIISEKIALLRASMSDDEIDECDTTFVQNKRSKIDTSDELHNEHFTAPLPAKVRFVVGQAPCKIGETPPVLASAAKKPFLKKVPVVRKLEWKLPRSAFKSSIYDKIATYEKVDVKLVKSFIHNNMGINYKGVLHHSTTGYANERLHIKTYGKTYNQEEDKFYTGYGLPRHRWGRINPHAYASMCVIPRGTRHAFAQENYVDIDMENAQPVILSQFCKQNYYDCEQLFIYCKDKKPLRAQIMEHHDCSKDIAKQLPITLMMGGTYKGWIRHNNISANDKVKLPAVDALESEMVQVKEAVFENNQDIRNDVLKQNPKKWCGQDEEERGVMGLWCQSLERLVQECAIRMMIVKYNIPIESIIPCQDGFMILF